MDKKLPRFFIGAHATFKRTCSPPHKLYTYQLSPAKKKFVLIAAAGAAIIAFAAVKLAFTLSAAGPSP